MNYYEELGIRSDADEEEIRKAHRRLVKLMHPDQHRDAGLKALAETQMRRLNSIVATLLDPDERQEYDEQLRGGGGDPLNPQTQQTSWKAVPWWIASTLGAIILTVGTLWFFADRMGPSRHDKTPPTDVADIAPNEAPGIAKAPESAPQAKPQEEVTTVQVPPTQPVPNPAKSQEPKPEPVKPPPPKPVEVIKTPEVAKAVKAPVAPALKPVLPPPPVKETVKKPAIAHQITPAPVVRKQPKVVARQTPPVVKPLKPSVTAPPPAPSKVEVAKAQDAPKPYVATVIPPPAVAPPKENLVAAAPPPPPASLTAAAPAPIGFPKVDYPPVAPVTRLHDPLEGEWVYAPTAPEKRRPGLFLPEFIQLKLVKDPNGMHGEYSARYNVDKPVSPDVNFVVKATDETAMKYVWTAANGAHGWMMIRDLDTDTMRLEWKDTSKHNGQQLTSGQATLVRKN